MHEQHLLGMHEQMLVFQNKQLAHEERQLVPQEDERVLCKHIVGRRGESWCSLILLVIRCNK
jgi:hypothetical protein